MQANGLSVRGYMNGFCPAGHSGSTSETDSLNIQTFIYQHCSVPSIVFKSWPVKGGGGSTSSARGVADVAQQ